MTKVTSGLIELKDNVAVDPMAKLSFSKSSKETVASIQKLSQTVKNLLYKGLYEVELTLRQSSIRMVGEVIAAL